MPALYTQAHKQSTVGTSAAGSVAIKVKDESHYQLTDKVDEPLERGHDEDPD